MPEQDGLEAGATQRADEASLSPRSTEVILDWLTERLAHSTGIDPAEVDPREPFTSYGLSSSGAVELSGDLEDWLGRELSPTLVYEYPTPEILAEYLSSGESRPG